MKKILPILLTLLLIFSACKKEEPIEESVEPSVFEQVEDDVDDEVVVPDYFNGLTGEGTDEDINVNRPYAAMINNISVAQPQCGTSKADIIYEILAEGSITRMLAVFSDLEGSGALGSMRSARPYFIDIATSYDALFIHAGGSDDAYSTISSRAIDNIDGVRGYYGATAFYRDPTRQANGYEHSLFTNDELIAEITEELGYSTEHDSGSYDYGLKFTEDASPAGGFAAEKIVVNFASYKTTTFNYNTDESAYDMTQYGSKYIDGNTEEIQYFDNVIVLYAEHVILDGDGRRSVDLDSGGDGYFASGGAGCDIKWSRSPDGTFKYTLANGSDLELGVGRTFICIIPTDSPVDFS